MGIRQFQTWAAGNIESSIQDMGIRQFQTWAEDDKESRYSRHGQQALQTWAEGILDMGSRYSRHGHWQQVIWAAGILDMGSRGILDMGSRYSRNGQQVMWKVGILDMGIRQFQTWAAGDMESRYSRHGQQAFQIWDSRHLGMGSRHYRHGQQVFQTWTSVSSSHGQQVIWKEGILDMHSRHLWALQTRAAGNRDRRFYRHGRQAILGIDSIYCGQQVSQTWVAGNSRHGLGSRHSRHGLSRRYSGHGQHAMGSPFQKWPWQQAFQTQAAAFQIRAAGILEGDSKRSRHTWSIWSAFIRRQFNQTQPPPPQDSAYTVCIAWA